MFTNALVVFTGWVSQVSGGQVLLAPGSTLGSESAFSVGLLGSNRPATRKGGSTLLLALRSAPDAPFLTAEIDAGGGEGGRCVTVQSNQVKYIEATQRIPSGCLRRLPFPVDEKEAKISRYQGG